MCLRPARRQLAVPPPPPHRLRPSGLCTLRIAQLRDRAEFYAASVRVLSSAPSANVNIAPGQSSVKQPNDAVHAEFSVACAILARKVAILAALTGRRQARFRRSGGTI